MQAFLEREFLPASALARINETRVTDPECPARSANLRKRRSTLTRDGKLNILAADHPARRVTKVGDDPVKMADRHGYLARIVRVLQSDVVDGVMATMDVLEDLLILHHLLLEAGGPALLDDRLLIASLNRGGLAGTSWEMDDPVTGASPATCGALKLDGAKLLLRICDEETSSLNTILYCSRVVTEMNALGLPTFLEPLPVVKENNNYKVIKTADALAKIVGVGSALGDSSRHLWLKLPYCENYQVVARATTLPILLLGGESVGDATPLLREIAAGLDAGPNVRGALVGRNVLYPGAEDPFVVAQAAGSIIHNNWTVERALNATEAAPAPDMNKLANYFHGVTSQASVLS
ncbi:MAG: class I fructose-bisphosphate aldolase [Pyrinomonadaceae bacterium]